jgi:simple sugar transport system permease protein
MKLQRTNTQKLVRFLGNNTVPILFLIICAFGIPLSGYSTNYLVSEIIVRIARNSFLIVSLLIPILAGMGLNFGMTLGAMAGQIGLIFISDWGVVGIPGILLAMIISTPISILLGLWCGKILNMAKGREMVTSYIIGFFMNGIYQLVVLYGMGKVIPIRLASLVLPRGYGIRNTVNLIGIRKTLDNLLTVKIFGIPIPLATIVIITVLCLFVLWFKKTKLGQDMRAVGQDMEVARAAGIRVEHTRIVSIVMSTVFAGYGMIIYLQNIGTLNTYNSHSQIGMFSVAALLVGGASVSKANIRNVFLGVILFHLMFIVSPMAGKNLIGQAQLGEYFRVFVSYGVITVSLVLYEVRKKRDLNIAGQELAAEQGED